MNDIVQGSRPRLHAPRRVFRAAARMLLCGFAAALATLPAVAGSVSYTYDALGRLKTATYSNGVVITYNYDAAGNRTSQVTTGAP